MSDLSTTRCTAWAITRADGKVLGFTDHDADLTFAGITFRAASGMTAATLVQGNGLSVDNTEGYGTLSDDAMRENDIRAGLFDGADVQIWEVNWQAPAVRQQTFHGTLGEITLEGGAWRAELRGPAEALSRPLGRSYQRGCAAVLGDKACGFDLTAPGFTAEAPLLHATDTRLTFAALDFDPRWFERGQIRVLSGAAAGVTGVVKTDEGHGDTRVLTLWSPLGQRPEPGALIRLLPGCDKRMATCRAKFGNLLNYRGFPHIPGEDWLLGVPKAGAAGESLFK